VLHLPLDDAAGLVYLLIRTSDGAKLYDNCCIENRGQWIAQLVRKHCQKLVFPTIRFPKLFNLRSLVLDQPPFGFDSVDCALDGVWKPSHSLRPFDDVIVGPILHRLDGDFLVPAPGEQDNGAIRPLPLDDPEHLNAIGPVHLVISDDGVVFIFSSERAIKPVLIEYLVRSSSREFLLEKPYRQESVIRIVVQNEKTHRFPLCAHFLIGPRQFIGFRCRPGNS
jgi:hypothetical protein